MLHFIIVAANYDDSELVRKRVKRVLASSNLTEDVDFALRDFSTSNKLKDYLADHHFLQWSAKPTSRQSPKGDHVLVIAQPTLTDMDDTKPVLRQLLRGDPDSVVLLLLNNASAGRLPVKQERRLTDLSAQTVDIKLRGIIREFLKQHESFDYNKYRQRLNEYREVWLTPSRRPAEFPLGGNGEERPNDGEKGPKSRKASAQSDKLDQGEVTDSESGDNEARITTAKAIEAKWDVLVSECLDLAQQTLQKAAERFTQTHEKSSGTKSVGSIAEGSTASDGSSAERVEVDGTAAATRSTNLLELEAPQGTGDANTPKDSEISGDALLSLACAYLYLWVEAQLYSVRAESNYAVYESANATLSSTHLPGYLIFVPRGWGVSQTERAKVKAKVVGILRKYRQTLVDFDNELNKRAPGHAYFVDKLGDAEQFRAWSEDFQPKEDTAAYEPGWVIHAETVGRLLFMQYRKALGREYWRSPETWGRAVLYSLYWIVAGYGFVPGRTLIISLGVFFGFAVAQRLDDGFTPQCVVGPVSLSGFPWAPLRAIAYYIEVSTSSLTSLGAVATPCGEFHGFLSAGESLIGYFLLAILTTLFVQSILER